VIAEESGALGLRVLKPEDMRSSETRATLAAEAADLFAVVAFGAILSPELLRVPRLGCMNLHGSLLPAYRGASPVQRALWDGCDATGVTTMWMDAGIDTGDLVLQRWEPIVADDDCGTLGARLAALGGPLLAESLRLAHAGRAPRLAQDRGAGSYARKLAKRDGVVDWALDATQVWNRQRAVTPWPGATTWLRDRQVTIVRSRPWHRLAGDAAPGTVLELNVEGIIVACRPGALRLVTVRPEGRAHMGALDWGPVTTSYFGMLLMSASGIAVGMMFSSFTENQIVAFFVTAAVLALLWFVGSIVEFVHGPVGDAIAFVSFQTRFLPFSRGLIHTRAVIYFLSITILCLLVAFRSLESRKWS
jgi:methionyl-tRNA formyltransferase